MKIQETIVISQNRDGVAHIAPMGLHVIPEGYLVLPFKPSTTLNNILETGVATVNYCDDVRVFAGCLTGRRDWPLSPAQAIDGQYLSSALAHSELSLIECEDDELRPKLKCNIVQTVNHAPFRGFNRGQYAVIEAAILISRLHMLPWDKIANEIDYLKIGLEKTGGEREREAWGWLMAKIDAFKQQHPEATQS